MKFNFYSLNKYYIQINSFHRNIFTKIAHIRITSCIDSIIISVFNSKMLRPHVLFMNALSHDLLAEFKLSALHINPGNLLPNKCSYSRQPK